MSIYQALVFLHIAAGSVALISFWTAAALRKGSPRHKSVGKVYLLAMLGILATSLPMAIWIAARGNLPIGIFLGYLVVITGTACWLSWRAIRLKADAARFYGTRYRSVGILNLVSGLLVFAVGASIGNGLLMGFCWVGVFLGIGMLRKASKTPEARNWWLREHYGAMLGNGVATHVAFLSIGLREWIGGLGVAWLNYLPWFAPLLLAVLAGAYLDRRYGQARRLPS